MYIKSQRSDQFTNYLKQLPEEDTSPTKLSMTKGKKQKTYSTLYFNFVGQQFKKQQSQIQSHTPTNKKTTIQKHKLQRQPTKTIEKLKTNQYENNKKDGNYDFFGKRKKNHSVENQDKQKNLEDINYDFQKKINTQYDKLYKLPKSQSQKTLQGFGIKQEQEQQQRKTIHNLKEFTMNFKIQKKNIKNYKTEESEKKDLPSNISYTNMFITPESQDKSQAASMKHTRYFSGDKEFSTIDVPQQNEIKQDMPTSSRTSSFSRTLYQILSKTSEQFQKNIDPIQKKKYFQSYTNTPKKNEDNILSLIKEQINNTAHDQFKFPNLIQTDRSYNRQRKVKQDYDYKPQNLFDSNSQSQQELFDFTDNTNNYKYQSKIKRINFTKNNIFFKTKMKKQD